jgi:hypothetical protein
LPRQDLKSVVVITSLAAIALLVRLLALEQHFLLIDEAFVGVAARDIAFNNTPMWDAVSNAPYVWGLAQMISLFGDSSFILRLPSAIFGASVSILIFLFIRRWAGQRVALVSAAIYALHPFAVAFTRVAFVDALQLPAIWLSIFAVDRYFLETERKWLITALVGAALAFVFKYNAIAVIGCWMFAGLVLKRYPIKRSIVTGILIIIASLGTLLLWPYDAPTWFFSFLVKGGSYDGQYIWDFYHYAYRHVTFGSATLPSALIAYFIMRPVLDKVMAKRFDQYLLFGFLYFGLLLLLGRPFQRYLLVLTVPVAVIYGMLTVKGYESFRTCSASREKLQLLRTAAGLVVLIGVLVQGFRSSTNYVAYLENDLDLPYAVADLKGADRVFWPSGSISVNGYYLGFQQYYSLASRGPLNADLSRHYFLGSPLPYAADTLPYGVFLAREELKREGLFSALLHPKAFGDKVKTLDAGIDRMKNSRPLVDYYNSDVVRPGDLLVETRGIVDQNGEPMLYRLVSGEAADHTLPKGFEFVSAFVNGQRFTDTTYRRGVNEGEVRILRKVNAQ